MVEEVSDITSERDLFEILKKRHFMLFLKANLTSPVTS